MQGRKEYRTYLNKKHGLDATGKGHKGRHKPRTRLYGDYLWHQDREMFEASYQEYIQTKRGQ